MKLSIIIPVMNQWNYTRYVLDNLLKTSGDFEVIVFDNGSGDATKAQLTLYAQKYKDGKFSFIRSEKNLGFGEACNRSYKTSKGEAVLFLNNDIKLTEGSFNFINKLADDVLQSNDCLFGPTAGFVDPRDQFNFKYETEDPSKEVNYMSGWCLAAKRSVFDSLIEGNNCGPFDAETFFVYYEDTDLGLRSLEKNIKYKLYKVPMIHLGKKTSSTLNVSKLYTESRKKFMTKWTKRLTSQP